GAGGGRNQTGGHGSGRTTGGTAGYAAGIPGVLHRTVVAGFVGRAHGELVHVQLAESHGAGGGQLLDHGGVVGRLEAGEDLRGTGGQHTPGAEQVLVSDWRTEQGTVLASGAAGVGGAGLFQGQLFGDGDETVQLRVKLADTAEQFAAQFFGGKLLGGQGAGNFGQGQLVHGKPFPYSMTFGTRYRP